MLRHSYDNFKISHISLQYHKWRTYDKLAIGFTTILI